MYDSANIPIYPRTPVMRKKHVSSEPRGVLQIDNSGHLRNDDFITS